MQAVAVPPPSCNQGIGRGGSSLSKMLPTAFSARILVRGAVRNSQAARHFPSLGSYWFPLYRRERDAVVDQHTGSAADIATIQQPDRRQRIQLRHIPDTVFQGASPDMARAA
jgi:hypothetical protein